MFYGCNPVLSICSDDLQMEKEIERIVSEASQPKDNPYMLNDVDAMLDNDGNSTEDMKNILEQI